MTLHSGGPAAPLSQLPSKLGEDDDFEEEQPASDRNAQFLLALQQAQIRSQEEISNSLQKQLALARISFSGQPQLSQQFSSIRAVQSVRGRKGQTHHYSPSMGTIPATSSNLVTQHNTAAKMSPAFERDGQEEPANLSVLQESIILLKESVRRLPAGGYDTHINSILTQLDQEWGRIRDAMDACSKLRYQLASKAQQLEKFELETLETKVQLDYKAADYEQRVLQIKGTAGRGAGGGGGHAPWEEQADKAVQTSLGVESLQKRESSLRTREKEIEFQSFKINEEIDEREKYISLRQRDIEVREQVVAERLAELEKREKQVQSRLFKLKTAPLDALEEREKLLERVRTVRLLSAAGEDLERLEGMQGFVDFWKREDVQDFYSEFAGPLQAKALGLLQCEFMLLREREKVSIAQSFIQQETATMDREREAVKQEREKYLYLNDFERYIQTENVQIEEKKEELSRLTKSLLEGAESQIQAATHSNPGPGGATVDLSALLVSASPSAIPGSRTPASGFDIKTSGVRSVLEGSAALMSRNLAESVERMTTIENLKRELLSQPGQSVRVSPPASPDRTDTQIKKLLAREASFLDQEKRILDEQRKRLKAGEAQKVRAGVKGTLTSGGGGGTEDLSLLKHQLELEVELQKELNAEMNLELKKLDQRAKLLQTREERFNAEKVRFLKRLDKLRSTRGLQESEPRDEDSEVEDSVYSYEIDALLQRESELGAQRTRQAQRQEAVVKAAVLARLSQVVLLKRPLQKSKKVKLTAAFELWQLRGFLFKTLQALRRSQSLLVEEGAFQSPQKKPLRERKPEDKENRAIADAVESISPEELGDWWEHYWARRSRVLTVPRIFPKGAEKKDLEMVKLNRQMDRKLLNEIERFWKFRARNVLRLALLHNRRRERLTLAFSFFRFRIAAGEARTQHILTQRHRYAYSKAFTVTTSEGRQEKPNSNASVVFTVGRQELPSASPGGEVHDGTPAGRRFERQSPSLIVKPDVPEEEELAALTNTQLRNIPGGMANLPPDHETFAGQSAIMSNPSAFLQAQIQQTPQLKHIQEEIGEDTRPQHFVITEAKGVQARLLAEELGTRVFEGLSKILRVLVAKQHAGRKLSLLQHWVRWVQFSKAAEVLLLKGELSRIAMSLQDLKFQENLFRTNILLQRNELDSKVRELVVARLGGSGGGGHFHQHHH